MGNLNSLTAISAYDNAQIKTFGKLSTIDLNINLNNNATAKLNLDVNDVKIALNDNAKAQLSGYADQSEIELNSRTADVDTSKFTAATLVNQQIPTVMAAARADDDLVIIE